MKKKYDLTKAEVSSKLEGSYKKRDETDSESTYVIQLLQHNMRTYIATREKYNRLIYLEKRSSKIAEASPTNWQYESFERPVSSVTPSTFHFQTGTITSITKGKELLSNQRLSLVQEYNQILEGNKDLELYQFFCKSDLKNEHTPVKHAGSTGSLYQTFKNSIHSIAKSFSPNKEVFSYGNRLCNDEFYHFKNL